MSAPAYASARLIRLQRHRVHRPDNRGHLGYALDSTPCCLVLSQEVSRMPSVLPSR